MMNIPQHFDLSSFMSQQQSRVRVSSATCPSILQKLDTFSFVMSWCHLYELNPYERIIAKFIFVTIKHIHTLYKLQDICLLMMIAK